MVQAFPRSGNPQLPMPAHRRALAGLPPQQVSRVFLAPSPFRRGLGASAVGNEASSLSSVGGTLASTGLTVGASTGMIAASTAAIAIPVIGVAVAVVALLAMFLNGGCGQACIVSAKAEQIYEAACDDLEHVARLGMLGASDCLTGIQNFIAAGQQHLEQFVAQGDKKAQDGITNLNKSTQGNLTYASSLPATATVPLDLTKAQAAFIAAGAAGWYPDAVAAGNQLALAYLQALVTAQQTVQQSETSGIAVSPTTGAVSVLGTTFSMGEVLAGLAVAGAVIYFAF